ncbi:DUF6461 domain-containing protein [Actinoplanes missouriensis]|uniref:DUF6461 domain-containing protein n=1 Tax=Actinoplanes missouriensis TaxID=1866 RepID=UPI0033D13649
MYAANADDYAWFTEQFAELADGHCLTLIRGRTPAEVIERVGGTNPTRAVGVRRLTGESFVAAAEIGEWTLLFQPDDREGTASERELSRGTVLVSHSATRFLWARDGEVVLRFDPADPSRRSGTDPDGLVEVLDGLGFDTTTAGDEPGPGGVDDARLRERGLALAEQLTGVRLTLEAFEALTFTRAAAPSPAEAADQPEPATRAGWPATAESPQASSRRPAAKPERWDEEYDAPAEDWSDADSDDDEETDTDDREWPRLIARVRRAFT